MGAGLQLGDLRTMVRTFWSSWEHPDSTVETQLARRDEIFNAWESQGRAGLNPDVAAWQATVKGGGAWTRWSDPNGIIHAVLDEIDKSGGAWAGGIIAQPGYYDRLAQSSQAYIDAHTRYTAATESDLFSDVVGLVKEVAPVLKVASFVAGPGAEFLADFALEEVAETAVEEFAEDLFLEDFMWDDYFLGDWTGVDSGGVDIYSDFGTSGSIGAVEIPDLSGVISEVPSMGGIEDLVWSFGRDVAARVITDELGGGAALPGGAQVTRTAFPALPAIAGAARAAGSMVGRAASALGGGAIVASVGGVIRRISAKNVAALAKRVGIDAAAAALGITAVQVAQAVMADEKRKRRGSGITASQYRTTTKTLRKFHTMQRRIKDVCSDVMPRRRACR